VATQSGFLDQQSCSLSKFGRDSGENFLDRNSGRDLPQAVPIFGRVVGCGRLMAAAPPLTDLLILCINGAFEVILLSSPLQSSTVLDHVLRTSGLS